MVSDLANDSIYRFAVTVNDAEGVGVSSTGASITDVLTDEPGGRGRISPM